MKKKGFTLIELLATIVILAAMAVVITLTVQDIIKSSKILSAKESVRNIFSTCYTHLVSSQSDGAKTYTVTKGRVTDANNNVLDINKSTSGDGNVYIAHDDVTWGCVEYPELNGIIYRLYGDSDVIYADKKDATCESILSRYASDFTFINGSTTSVEVGNKYILPEVKVTTSSSLPDYNNAEQVVTKVSIQYNGTEVSSFTGEEYYANKVVDFSKMDTTYVDRTYHIVFTTYDKSLGLEYTSDAKNKSLDIKVVDTAAPSIAINSNTTTVPNIINKTIYVNKGASVNLADNRYFTITDNSCDMTTPTLTPDASNNNNCSNVKTPTINNGGLNTSVPGEYTVTYTSTDKMGNNSSASMKVAVIPDEVSIPSAGETIVTIPVSGYYYLNASGAQGSNNGVYTGGLGGNIKGEVYLTAGTVLKVKVGSQAGYNGGGLGGTAGVIGGGATTIIRQSDNYTLVTGAGGGGASNIAAGGAGGSGTGAGAVKQANCGSAGTAGTNGSGGGSNGSCSYQQYISKQCTTPKQCRDCETKSFNNTGGCGQNQPYNWCNEWNCGGATCSTGERDVCGNYYDCSTKYECGGNQTFSSNGNIGLGGTSSVGSGVTRISKTDGSKSGNGSAIITFSRRAN